MHHNCQLNSVLSQYNTLGKCNKIVDEKNSQHSKIEIFFKNNIKIFFIWYVRTTIDKSGLSWSKTRNYIIWY